MQQYMVGRLRALCAVAVMVCALFLFATPVFADTVGSIGSWTTATDHLPLTLCGASSVTYNGYEYIMGGVSSSAGHLDTVYYAKLNSDGTTGSWTTSPNNLPSLLYYPSAATNNGYIYVMGGYDGGFHDAIYYAKINSDGSIGSWTTNGNALPQGMYEGAANISNGYLYFIGGMAGGGGLNTVYYAPINANGSVGTWNTETNHLPTAVENGGSFVANGYMYTMGGYSGSAALSSVYYSKLNSDGTTGSWATNTAALPQAVNGPTAVSSNGYAYVAGGNNSSNSSQNTVYYAPLNSDGSITGWTTSTNTLPQALQFSASTVNDGFLYVFGGQTNGSTKSAVYYAPLSFVSQKSLTGGSQPVAIATPAGTNITNATTTAPTSADSGYTYPLGLLNFTFTTDTLTNQVSLNFQTNLTPSQVVARKYNPTTHTYSTIPGAVITQTTLSGQPALNVSYSITDGGPLDEDGMVNGVIVDPVGLAETTNTSGSTATAPNTGYGTPQRNMPAVVIALIALAALTSGTVLVIGSYRKKHD